MLTMGSTSRPSSGFRNSLVCLQHPASWAAILLLLLNDHVLKQFTPSWITGKLSDFAGLFFFPYLITAVASIFLDRIRVSRRIIGLVTFGFVGIGFSLLKISPFVNQWFSQVASQVLATPVHYALDPTDTLALLTLWPSWLLWNRSYQLHPYKFAYISLIFGALASLATSPVHGPTDISSVNRVTYSMDLLFAADIWDTGLIVSQSKDGGTTWECLCPEDHDDCNSYATMFEEELLPIVVCDPRNKLACYRITGDEVVYGSIDGGTTWNVNWHIPGERYAYMERSWKYEYLDVGPFDIEIITWEDARILLVAAGNLGLLRKELPDGNWEYVTVGYAEPDVLFEHTLEDTRWVIEREANIIAGIIIAVQFVSTLLLWWTTKNIVQNKKRRNWLITTVLTFGVLTGALWFCASGWPIYDVTCILAPPLCSYLATFSLIFFPCLVLLIMTMVWFDRIKENDKNQRILFWYLQPILGILIFGITPFSLWALGIIWRYGYALALSILSSSFFACVSFYKIFRYGRYMNSLERFD